MYKYINILFYGLVFAFCSFLSKAQTYPFVNFTVENGLSQVQVLSVFQNNDGVMWFGTSGGGITLYDGKNYEYITDKDGLADNVVFCIAKDKNGCILIGTNNGLSVYDINGLKNKKIKNYFTKDGLSHNRIFTIQFDENNTALLGTAKGISTFKNGTCGTLKINQKLDSSSVFHILKDSKKQLWLSTLGGGVFRYNTTVKNYTTKEGIKNDMVFAVLEKSPNIYWFLTGEGLCKLENEKISQINTLNIDSSATYYAYHKDKNNSLYFATDKGVIKLASNGDALSFRKENGLVNNSIWKIYEDRESNLWFTSNENGISKLSSQKFYIYNSKNGLLFDDIKKIYQTTSGNYWIGTKLGITIKNGEKYTNYTYKELSGSAEVWSIIQDKNKKFLIGTSNGLLIYENNSFKRIVSKEKDSQMNVIYDVFIDNKGTVWCGTPIGVAQLINGNIQLFTKAAITNNYVNKIFQDEQNNYWFATDDGLFYYTGSTVRHFTEKDGFTQKKVLDIKVDKQKNLWFSTSEGLFKYDYKTFTNISEKEGLFSNEVNAFVIETNGTVWAGFTNGLDKIIQQNGKYSIKHYSVENGFIGIGCSENAMIINNNNQLVIGTSKGLMVYQSEFDKENALEPITKLKNIDLFFQKTDWSLYSDTIDQNNIPFNLKLPYNKNYLTFNFIGVSLTTPEKVSYKYMLKGIDKDWRFSTKTDATYSNIPPGNYEFVLYANNGEGVWNKQPVVYNFSITPPFWRTWWFYSIILLIILTGVYSYFKIRTANKKILKQNEIIAEKNGALQNANIEIAEKNKNITDSINYAKRIQQNFLTSEKILNTVLKEHFILFKPRDIVSGDFYLAFDLEDRIVIVCADCTGHGIPGAFMSLIAISLLNEIARAKTILSTAQILEELRERIINALNPEKNESGGKDGMDISILSILKHSSEDKITIDFSGANSSMYIVHNKDNKINMVEYKGDKQPVGYYSNMMPFTQLHISAQKGDIIYLFTDGYADQFGGKNGKKLMSKHLKQQILSVYNLPLLEQKSHLDATFLNWQGKLEQVDDVTVMGIKLS